MAKRAFTVQTKIERPADVVFNAMVDAEQLCQYFTDSTSGPLEEGQTITWHWSQWGDFPVKVKSIKENESIVLELDSTEWKKTETDGYPVTVELEVESLDNDSCMLSISETGWKTDEPGLRGSHDNCSGWTHMAMCLKGYVEHQIDLR